MWLKNKINTMGGYSLANFVKNCVNKAYHPARKKACYGNDQYYRPANTINVYTFPVLNRKGLVKKLPQLSLRGASI